jgi:hypothetical protein
MWEYKTVEGRLNEVRSNLDVLALSPLIRGNLFAYTMIDRSLEILAELLGELKGVDKDHFKQQIIN